MWWEEEERGDANNKGHRGDVCIKASPGTWLAAGPGTHIWFYF